MYLFHLNSDNSPKEKLFKPLNEKWRVVRNGRPSYLSFLLAKLNDKQIRAKTIPKLASKVIV